MQQQQRKTDPAAAAGSLPGQPWTDADEGSGVSGWARFRQHRLAVAGLVFIIVLAAAALLAPWLAPHDPYEVTAVFQGAPSADYLLGTDQIGRDVFSRLIYASRVSLLVGIGAVAIYMIIGTLLGLLAGYFGGWVDTLIMRLVDIMMSFPALLVILVLVSIVGPSLFNVILVLGLLGWPAVTRIVRGSVLTIKQADYIKAGIALGLPTHRLLFRHILLNASAPILVKATFGVATAILTEASLSFLGVGVQPPTASWGNMLTEAQSLTTLANQYWLWVPPGLMIVLTVLSVNFIGDGIRDTLDPKSIS